MMKTSLNCLLALTLLCICLVRANSQSIVNIEQKRIITDTVGWAGSIDLTFNLNKDEATQYSFTENAHVQFKSKRSLYLLLTNLSILEAGERRFVNSGFVHGRYNRKFTKLLRWEFFSQWQFNKILEVNQRVLLGTGPRLKLFGAEKFSMYQGTLYMFEYEEVIDPRAFNRDHRISAYVSAAWKPSKKTSISGTWYFQPLIEDFSDNRLSGQLKVELGITDKLKFTTTFNYLHDTNPPPGVTKVAYRMSNGLGYKF